MYTPRRQMAFSLLLIFLFSLLLPPQMAAADDPVYEWKLVSTEVNPYNEKTAFFGGGQDPDWFPEARFEGKSLVYGTSSTNFTIHDRDVDRDYVYRDVTVSVNFSEPPGVLQSGQLVVLKAAASASGSVNEGGSTAGLTFQYQVGERTLEPTLSYSPWEIDEYFEDPSLEWTFTAPKASPGGEFTVSASLWNAGPCYVVWTYQAREVTEATKYEDTPELREPQTEEECAEIRQFVAENISPSIKYGVEDLKLGIIGRVIAQMGESRIRYCEGGSGVARVGTAVRIGDCIENSSSGMMRVQLHDRDEELDAGPSVINISRNTTLCFDDFEVAMDRQRYRRSTVTLITGTIREFLKGWGRGSSANIKTGVTVCGMRGTDVIVSYDPTTETTLAYISEGTMDVTSTITGEMETLQAGERLRVENGQLGEVLPLKESDWQDLLSSYQLDDESVDLSYGGKIPELSSEPAAVFGFSGAVNYLFLAFGAALVIGLVIAGITLLKQKEGN